MRLAISVFLEARLRFAKESQRTRRKWMDVSHGLDEEEQ